MWLDGVKIEDELLDLRLSLEEAEAAEVVEPKYN